MYCSILASCPSLSPTVCSNSCPLNQWCHPTISSSVAPFTSSCLQSFPASGSFPRSQFFTSGSRSIGVSALASVLPMNIQYWFPFRLTGLILQSKGFSRVFSNITVQKHQFFSTQLFIVQLLHPYMTTGKTSSLWIKVNWTWSSRRWQEWTSTSWETEMEQEWVNIIQITIMSTVIGKNPLEEMK